jgi:hypothetical protein
VSGRIRVEAGVLMGLALRLAESVHCRLLNRRASAAVAFAAVVVCATTSCVSPAINSEGYRGKVQQSATRLVGVIGSAQLAAQLELDGKMLSTITDELISEAEQDAQSVSSSLDSVQPPDQASISLRDRADSVLQDASSQLSDLRIAERRGDRDGMRTTLDELAKTLVRAHQLEADT